MKYIICFIVLFVVSQVNGQEQYLSGHVVDTSGIALSDIHILNKSLKKGTTTNQNGNFEIVIRLGDTLEISSVQYINIHKIVKRKDIGKPIQIVMHKNNRILSDIVLMPRPLFLDTTSRAQGDIDLKLPFKNNIVKRPYIDRQYDVLKPKAQFYGIGVSASFLGSFTKEYKEIKTLKIVKEEDSHRDRLYNYFEESFYSKTLRIPENKSILFIDYCLQKESDLNQFIETKNIYKLIERLKYHSIGFNEQFKTPNP